MAATTTLPRSPHEKIDWWASTPFIICHLMPFAAIFTGVHLRDFVICAVLYWLRVFGLTAGYHRYFAHRSYRMGRIMQFIIALIGTLSVQKGVLWWAGHHRSHHRYSDGPEDIHSPKKGFWWSHVGWFLCRKYNATPFENIPDFAKYPELRWINKYHLVPPILLAVGITWLWGWSALYIGFFLSTVLLWHGTFVINSLAHVWGRRRYVTTDTSRNNFFLAFITMGEGWHNNHHRYQAAARQGFYWWEFDPTYYMLKLLSWLGVIKKLRPVPESAYREEDHIGGQAAA